MSKRKYTKEFKLKALKEHEEEASFYSLEKKYGITLGTVKQWNSAFQTRGEDFLTPQNSDLCRYMLDGILNGVATAQSPQIKISP